MIPKNYPNLNEYEKLVLRMNSPRVVIDNATCGTATLVKVDSARNHEFLLDTVQVLTDLNLLVHKAYISSDGPYFMDVFHVTDQFGSKVKEESDIAYIQDSIQCSIPSLFDDDDDDDVGVLALELTGVDRPGLLSEIFAVLNDLQCSVSEAKVWTHNGRVASIISLEEDNAMKCSILETRLSNIVQGMAVMKLIECHMDRRLHQMMFQDRDYENCEGLEVSIENLIDPGYTVVNVECRDRPKLLFDIICTLTDMEYVVFHGNIYTEGDRAHQEFYIRHKDGTPIKSEAERQRVLLCLQSAINRRSYNGLQLEVSTNGYNKGDNLSKVTRALRENGLLVTRAEVSTSKDDSSNTFFVTTVNGEMPETRIIDSVRQRLGDDCLVVKEENVRRICLNRKEDEEVNRSGVGLFYIGNLFLRNLYYMGLIKSCS